MNKLASFMPKMFFESELNSGLVFSFTVHLVVAAVAIMGLPAIKRDFNSYHDIIPVEFVTIDDVTRSIAQPQPQPEAETPQEQQRQVTESVAPQAVPTLEDANSRTAIEETMEPSRPRPDVAPRSKPRPPSALDTSRIAALIDRSKQQQAASAPVIEDNSQKIEDAVERMQMSQMEARRATITLQALIRSKVESCWSIPAGANAAEDLAVSVRIYLRPNGTLARAPEFVDTSRMSEPYYRAAAESAVRAVRRCAPYELPADQYQLWRELIFTFDPKELLDG